MSYVIQAVIQNPHVPDYGVATIPFPLDREAYDPTLREIVFPLDIGVASPKKAITSLSQFSYQQRVDQ